MTSRADHTSREEYPRTALAALQNLPDAAVLVFDADLRYVLVAGQAVGQTGFDPDAVEGRPIFSVQHHPEASPGPKDSLYLFERFAGMMDKAKTG